MKKYKIEPGFQKLFDSLIKYLNKDVLFRFENAANPYLYLTGINIDYTDKIVYNCRFSNPHYEKINTCDINKSKPFLYRITKAIESKSYSDEQLIEMRFDVDDLISQNLAIDVELELYDPYKNINGFKDHLRKSLEISENKEFFNLYWGNHTYQTVIHNKDPKRIEQQIRRLILTLSKFERYNYLERS